jgi:hypothetical protein
MIKGRVKLHGLLFGEALASFYHGLDLLVTTEVHAGWCNTAAEAFANGVPCIVTPAGTLDFARHGENCIVLEEAAPDTIAGIIGRMTDNPEFLKHLAGEAVRSIQPFSYPAYAEQILEKLEKPAFKHYFREPELGLFGKWEPETRLGHLEAVLNQSGGAHVLDLGAAEGVISHCFAVQGGVQSIHGFEYEAGRVDFAGRLLSGVPETDAVFRQADLSDWKGFYDHNSDLLADQYDVVLFLGLYHHLPEPVRRDVLKSALDFSRRFFLIRTPRQYVEKDQLDPFIQEQGFSPIGQAAASEEDNIGWLGIYQRN